MDENASAMKSVGIPVPHPREVMIIFSALFLLTPVIALYFLIVKLAETKSST
jgi:hypothetical protein